MHNDVTEPIKHARYVHYVESWNVEVELIMTKLYNDSLFYQTRSLPGKRFQTDKFNYL